MEFIDHVILNDAADHYGILTTYAIKKGDNNPAIRSHEYDRASKHLRNFLEYHHLIDPGQRLKTFHGYDVEFRDGQRGFYLYYGLREFYVIDPDRPLN